MLISPQILIFPQDIRYQQQGVFQSILIGLEGALYCEEKTLASILPQYLRRNFVNLEFSWDIPNNNRNKFIFYFDCPSNYIWIDFCYLAF